MNKKAQKLKLVLPSKKYALAYLKAHKEFLKVGEVTAKGIHSPVLKGKDFSTYLRKAYENRKGINLEKGRVSSTLYWAMVGNKVVGRVDIRHKLNKGLRVIGGHIGYTVVPTERQKGYGTQMLALALKHTKKLGIKNVLVTCDDANTASKKIIESNGGKFIKQISLNGIKRLHYKIKL